VAANTRAALAAKRHGPAFNPILRLRPAGAAPLRWPAPPSLCHRTTASVASSLRLVAMVTLTNGSADAIVSLGFPRG
jgi:hypothetical protein